MTRPRIDRLFASNALPEDIGDPDVFTPANPPYPHRVPEQYKAGWFVSDDEVVKQPHQWINFFYNGLDKGIYSNASRYNYWSSKVEYEFEAIVYYGNNFFKALKSNPTGTPALVSTEWEVCFTTLEEFMILINEVIGSADGHMARRDNPHNVTPAQVDAYTKPQVDETLDATLVNTTTHKNRKDNPHSVTYDQIGVLPTSGGIFTGAVDLHDMQLSKGIIRCLVAAIRLEAFSTRFGVRSDTGLNKDNLEVVSFNNYEAMKIRNNPKFANQQPDITIPLNGDLNFFSSQGIEVVEYTGDAYSFTDYLGNSVSLPVDTPGFNIGLHVDVTKAQTLKLVGAISTGLSLFAIVDDIPTFVFVSNGNNINLLSVLGVTKSVRDINIWFGPLDDYFKSSLI